MANHWVRRDRYEHGPGRKLSPKKSWRIEIDSLLRHFSAGEDYAAEPGSSVVRRAVAESDLIATSLMSYVEARSALARKGRSGDLVRAVLDRCRREFGRDWARLHRPPVDETLVRKAGDLAEEHALHAFDALHLAAADSLQALLRAAVTFACFDGALNGAAKVHGLELLVRNQG